MIQFAFSAPAERLSLNDRMHWARRAKIAKQWREATAVYARNHAVLERLVRPLPPSLVTVTYVFGDNRRRDAGNLAATTKHVIDGLVDAGWFDDDDHTRVAERTAIEVDRARAGQVRITVTPMEQP